MKSIHPFPAFAATPAPAARRVTGRGKGWKQANYLDNSGPLTVKSHDQASFAPMIPLKKLLAALLLPPTSLLLLAMLGLWLARRRPYRLVAVLDMLLRRWRGRRWRTAPPSPGDAAPLQAIVILGTGATPMHTATTPMNWPWAPAPVAAGAGAACPCRPGGASGGVRAVREALTADFASRSKISRGIRRAALLAPMLT
jgi:hypothetical protein